MAIQVLSIGNSFSQDAQRYIYEVAKSEGVDIQTTNLYIGGCPLDKHYRNIMSGLKEYAYEVNGFDSGIKVSIFDALIAKSWDYITIQQVSSGSFNYETFQPYASALAEFIRKCCPKAKLLVHQTWGYASESDKIKKMGFANYNEMFAKVEEAYNMLKDDVKADGLIPSGAVLKKALELGMDSVHRDGFHAKLGVGRFMIALTWYKYLTGNSIDNVSYNWFDEEVTEEEYKIAIKAVNEVLK